MLTAVTLISTCLFTGASITQRHRTPPDNDTLCDAFQDTTAPDGVVYSGPPQVPDNTIINTPLTQWWPLTKLTTKVVNYSKGKGKRSTFV